ncbi:lysozyme inhibitor LprI family protein [Pantoea sp. FN0307]|uniref:lysozyme inhibitor LprI family protein n=1 Tax=Pantoea sp. FN0307 TaxID=3418560 RepID=UPI003CF66D5A
MKKSCVLIFQLFFISIAYGSSMLDGNMLKPCFRPDEDSLECIITITERSESALNLAYNKKLKEIKTADEMRWWLGSKLQKTRMANNFINSQRLWLDYRKSYCDTIAAPEENTHAYGEAQARCQINMNQRRIDEINMLYHPELENR